MLNNERKALFMIIFVLILVKISSREILLPNLLSVASLCCWFSTFKILIRTRYNLVIVIRHQMPKLHDHTMYDYKKINYIFVMYHIMSIINSVQLPERAYPIRDLYFWCNVFLYFSMNVVSTNDCYNFMNYLFYTIIYQSYYEI